MIEVPFSQKDFAAKWKEVIYEREPVISPEEFIEILEEDGFNAARDYLRRIVVDFYISIDEAISRSGNIRKSFARAYEIDPSVLTRVFSQKSESRQLPFEAVVKMVTDDNASLHDYLLRTTDTVVHPLRKHAQLIKYLSTLPTTRQNEILANIRKTLIKQTENHKIYLTKDMESTLVCSRIQEYCDDHTIPIQCIIDNATLRIR